MTNILYMQVMDASNASSRPVQKSAVVRASVSVVAGLVTMEVYYLSEKFLQNNDASFGMRVGAMIVPWLVMVLFLLFSKRTWRPDELETVINYRALGFAFYGTLFGIFAIDQLQAAEVLPEFAWSKESVLGLMALLLAVGTIWSKSRFR
jgi:hypothetical protein